MHFISGIRSEPKIGDFCRFWGVWNAPFSHRNAPVKSTQMHPFELCLQRSCSERDPWPADGSTGCDTGERGRPVPHHYTPHHYTPRWRAINKRFSLPPASRAPSASIGTGSSSSGCSLHTSNVISPYVRVGRGLAMHDRWPPSSVQRGVACIGKGLDVTTCFPHVGPPYMIARRMC